MAQLINPNIESGVASNIIYPKWNEVFPKDLNSTNMSEYTYNGTRNILSLGKYVYIFCYQNKFLVSSDYGKTFVEKPIDSAVTGSNGRFEHAVIHNGYVYVMTSSYKLYKTNGDTFTLVYDFSSKSDTTPHMCSNGTDLYFLYMPDSSQTTKFKLSKYTTDLVEIGDVTMSGVNLFFYDESTNKMYVSTSGYLYSISEIGTMTKVINVGTNFIYDRYGLHNGLLLGYPKNDYFGQENNKSHELCGYMIIDLSKKTYTFRDSIDYFDNFFDACFFNGHWYMLVKRELNYATTIHYRCVLLRSEDETPNNFNTEIKIPSSFSMANLEGSCRLKVINNKLVIAGLSGYNATMEL